jgi:hypothetical protein
MTVMNYSHHANLCLVNDVIGYKTGISTEGVELRDQYFAKFGIEDARNLISQAYVRPSNADTLCLVVRADFITLEAQNALLKILEEPPESSCFIFVLPMDLSLLPTLSSRFNLVKNSGSDTDGKTSEFSVFLESVYKDRLSAIDIAIKNKDLAWQRSIKTGLITYLKADGKKLNAYKELEFVARTLLTRGAANKMLLEHMSFLLATR